MENGTYIFKLEIEWEIINLLSELDKFEAVWPRYESREKPNLRQLKQVATVASVGASTRIEGSAFSDKEVGTILQKIDISKLSDRDSQEVVGYFDTLEIILESFNDIEISVGNIKNLHNFLLKYSKKDDWHQGNYKQHENAVEARMPDGTRTVIFKTTDAGYPTEDAMRSLMDWYNSETKTHPVVKCSIFTYEFLSIHPFQDGNGRLSRLLTTLILLKNGYNWVQYSSFEQEIERRKSEYYRVLRSCQSRRPGEDIAEWVLFFLDCLKNIKDRLAKKLEDLSIQSDLSERENEILSFIRLNPGKRSGEIAKELEIPSPTVKRLLAKLIEMKLINKHGKGPGTNYTATEWPV
jgi:Fic family protein